MHLHATFLARGMTAQLFSSGFASSATVDPQLGLRLKQWDRFGVCHCHALLLRPMDALNLRGTVDQTHTCGPAKAKRVNRYLLAI
jgi:hypothetical protein